MTDVPKIQLACMNCCSSLIFYNDQRRAYVCNACQNTVELAFVLLDMVQGAIAGTATSSRPIICIVHADCRKSYELARACAEAQLYKG